MAAPLDIPMPEGLLLQEGYSLRVAALDPSTGNAVPGVTIGLVVITADNIGAVLGGGGGSSGDWLIVPGPGA